MSICVTEIDDVVKFTVKGSFADRTGKDQAFSFTLTCVRVDVEKIEEVIQGGGKFSEFFGEHIIEWSGVLDKEKKAVPFSQAELDKLFKLPAVPLMTWRRYIEEIGAKTKN